jgi:hypothetical protein
VSSPRFIRREKGESKDRQDDSYPSRPLLDLHNFPVIISCLFDLLSVPARLCFLFTIRSILDSGVRTRQPEGERPRARGGAEAQRQGVLGRPHPGAAPREVRLLDFAIVSCLIRSVTDTVQSRLAGTDAVAIWLFGVTQGQEGAGGEGGQEGTAGRGGRQRRGLYRFQE